VKSKLKKQTKERERKGHGTFAQGKKREDAEKVGDQQAQGGANSRNAASRDGGDSKEKKARENLLNTFDTRVRNEPGQKEEKVPRPDPVRQKNVMAMSKA